jgi:hypothetical protein
MPSLEIKANLRFLCLARRQTYENEARFSNAHEAKTGEV